MNATSFYTVDYENKSNWKLGENKAKTNPIKANFIRHSLGEGGTNPKQTQFAGCSNEHKFYFNKVL